MQFGKQICVEGMHFSRDIAMVQQPGACLAGDGTAFWVLAFYPSMHFRHVNFL